LAKILVVDDDEGMLQVLNAMLSGAGHEVLQTANSDAAKAAYRPDDVDLVITDFFMPTEGGLEVIRAVRHQNPDAKIILISAADIRDGVDTEAFARQYGAQRALTKPVDSKVLLETVDALLAGNG
jgi:two-component system chemotaxis response regulator CheY